MLGEKSRNLKEKKGIKIEGIKRLCICSKQICFYCIKSMFLSFYICKMGIRPALSACQFQFSFTCSLLFHLFIYLSHSQWILVAHLPYTGIQKKTRCVRFLFREFSFCCTVLMEILLKCFTYGARLWNYSCIWVVVAPGKLAFPW